MIYEHLVCTYIWMIHNELKHGKNCNFGTTHSALFASKAKMNVWSGSKGASSEKNVFNKY